MVPRRPVAFLDVGQPRVLAGETIPEIGAGAWPPRDGGGGCLATRRQQDTLSGQCARLTHVKEGDRALLVNVGALMTRRVFGCTPDDDIEDVMAWMVQQNGKDCPDAP